MVGKSLVCQAGVWILLKSRETERAEKTWLSETRAAEKTPCFCAFGTPAGWAWHSGSFAGAADPALQTALVGALRPLTLCARAEMYFCISSQIWRQDWNGSRRQWKRELSIHLEGRRSPRRCFEGHTPRGSRKCCQCFMRHHTSVKMHCHG